MSAIRLARAFFLVSTLILVAEDCRASAFVRGAYYRLGEDDPGAMAGSVGNDPTQDSFGDNLDLQRFGSPRYAADVPPRGPLGSTLSMAFANEGLGGPAFPGFYSREDSLSMVEQGYALEAWVKAGPTNLDSIRTNLIAYNGQPEGNGFGLFLDGEDYVVRIGSFERLLGPATVSEWHHLAYVQSLGTASYYYDGKLVDETTSDPLPVAADGGFWLGGLPIGVNGEGTLLFNGWIDEVRYQSFNPLAAGAFNPTDFLIRPSPLVGDYNGNGAVDAADYVVWRKGLGTTYSQVDYDDWRSYFGQTVGSGSGAIASAAIPEPATLMLMILASAGVFISRRWYGRSVSKLVSALRRGTKPPPMTPDRIRFLLAAGIVVTVTSIVAAGPIAGIARTDGRPLETGPFDSHSTPAGPEISHDFQPMYLTSQPNLWTKTFQWEIAANTSLVPGNTLSIMESIPLIYPVGTDASVELPISDWHESIVSSDLSEYFQWDAQNPNASISASINGDEIPIHAHVSFSSDGKSVGFDFDPIHIPTQAGTADTPVVLEILKQVQWSGPVLDPLPTSHHIDIFVSEYPTTPVLVGDFNNDGVVDAADYIIWRKDLGTYIPSDYEDWRAHFGQTVGSGEGVNAAVPEPATLVLLMFAMAGWCFQRGRAA